MENFYKFADTAGSDEADLFVSGDIIENDDKWLYDWLELDGTAPKAFRAELDKYQGKRINVYIDSYGGSVFAGSAIYTMLSEQHRGGVTVKISSVAASAASVIAMAGDRVLMSPTAMLMIHNPSTGVYGDHNDLKKAEKALNAVKESIINAYEKKTGQPREKLSAMMEGEKWMDANEAMSLGFADGILGADTTLPADVIGNIKNSRMQIFNLAGRPAAAVKPAENEEQLRKFKHANARLDLINLI